MSTTFDRCEEVNVHQMGSALKDVYQKHSQGYSHNYHEQWQLLDVDMTALLAGQSAEGSTKGYFPQKRGARGRQLGRVIATRYDEIVYEQLYDGKTQLELSLCELLDGACDVLGMQAQHRQLSWLAREKKTYP